MSAQDQGQCTHIRVHWSPIHNEDGTMSSCWRCDSCPHELIVVPREAWNRRAAPGEVDLSRIGRAIYEALDADAAIAEFQRQTGGQP